MRPLKSSFSATPLDGVDGVLGVVGPVGVVGSDGESFAPPHAAMVMPHNASAAVSSLTWSDIGGGDPCFGVSDANQPKNSTSTRLATLKPGRCLYLLCRGPGCAGDGFACGTTGCVLRPGAGSVLT